MVGWRDTMLETICNFLFPAQCASCNALGSGLCERCFPHSDPITISLPTLRVHALGLYEGALRHSILALKDGRRDVALTLSERLASILPPNSLLVPIPTTTIRQRMRGFDGVVLLARIAATLANNVQVLEALERASTTPQQGRTRVERLAARNRFRCRAKALHDSHLILIDDVVTTGSSLEDCALTLRRAGAIVAEAVVVATTQRLR